MPIFKRFNSEVSEILQNGGIGIIPTDTIYGISASAFSRTAVSRIYRAKKRRSNSPFIVLVSSINDLKKFDIGLDQNEERFLRRYWPGKVSVILPCSSKKFSYLHRGTRSVAFRMPQYPVLRNLMRATGPLVSSSANITGKPSATTIKEASSYFKDAVDFYVDKGKLKSLPSTLVRLRRGTPLIIREGAVKLAAESSFDGASAPL
jgi:L-threonylcarbamoyladenylate synthase